MKPKGYDTTIARIAGKLLSGAGLNLYSKDESHQIVDQAVHLARMIVEETRRTEPVPVEPVDFYSLAKLQTMRDKGFCTCGSGVECIIHCKPAPEEGLTK